MTNQWSKARAWEWLSNREWFCGFNYLPRTAVNWVDMWQEKTFDAATIKQELTWAADVGFNTLRTNLPYIVWKNDRDGLIKRIDTFLSFCDHFDMQVMLTLLDDCEFSGVPAFLGDQNAPIPGIHNSRATGSPGRDLVMDVREWPLLEAYVRDILGSFATDARIAMWDLYNEPTNRMIFAGGGDRRFSDGMDAYSHRLMERAFRWARDERPEQPLTVAAWHTPDSLDRSLPMFEHPTDLLALELSDVISFHAYLPLDLLQDALRTLRSYDRPIFCTEWFARHCGSRIHEQLPVFRENNVGCYQWGLVKGKTQTNIPWPILNKNRRCTSGEWFHDLLHENGTPYDTDEVSCIYRLIRKSGQPG